MGVRRLEATQEICDKYKEEGLILKPVFFDAYNIDSYKEMIDTIIKNEGKIDILVNNFGTGRPEKDLDLVNGDEDTFFELFNYNVGSVYRLSKLIIPHMIENKGGSIVNISSVGGSIPDISRIGYGFSKSGGDIANSVLFFASEDSSYITGSILEVSGGYNLGTPQYAEFVGSKVVE